MPIPKPRYAPLYVSLFSVLIAGCGGGGGSDDTVTENDEGGDTNTQKTYAAPETLDMLQSLGYAKGGEPLTWDRAYTADLTGDGKDELLIYTSYDYLDQLDPSPYVVFGQKNGSFQVITDDLFPEGAPEAVGNRTLQLADINGDGHLDLFLDNHGTEAFTPFPGEQNQLYLSNGNGQWFDATDTHLPAIRDFSHGSTVGNIDNDPEPEILVINLGGGEAGYSGLNYLLDQNESGVYEVVADFRQNFNGIFPVELQTIGSPFFSKFVDLTGNGVMDVFGGPVTMPETGDLGYGYMALINDGSGSFEVANPETLPTPRAFPNYEPPVGIPEAILTGDIDGDGDKDILSYDRYGSFLGSYFSVFVNQGDGTFTEETEARLPGQDFGPRNANIPQAQLVDLDGDGHLDFIAKGWDWGADPNGGAFVSWLYLNDGTGKFVKADKADFPEISPPFAVLDIDGDGLNDIVSGDYDTIRVYRRLSGPE